MPEVADLWVNLQARTAQYKAAMAEAAAEGERFARTTTTSERATTRATTSTAALATETRRTTNATRGLTAEVRASESAATRFANKARLASEESARLANKAALASQESRRLAEQATAGGEGAAKLARQAALAGEQAERFGARSRLAGEHAQFLARQAALAGAEAQRLAAQETEAAAATERMGERATASTARLAAMGAEARHTAGSVGILSGSAMRMGTAFAGSAGSSNKFASGLKSLSIGALAVSVGVAAISTKMAGDFQAAMVRLKTSANETGDIIDGRLTGNLALVSKGVKDMAVATATPLSELSAAMYRIESAGFHGSQGLKILQAAAEGARAEGADLDTVANTLDSTMNAFGFKTSQVNGVMNAMVATVARGKASMQELSGALSTVTPIASAAGLKLQQMLGAMATMTAQGVSAKQASQNLAFAIRNLQAPSNVARQAMNSVGLDATELSKNLGKRGLTGTFDILSKAVTDHMGKDGMVIVKTMNDSKSATASAQRMLQGMTGDAKRLAQQYYSGKISLGAYKQAVKGLPSDQANLAMQFRATADNANGFNQMLKNGSGPQKTYADMLKKMMGGANGLNTFLELSGIHAGTFADNVKEIGKAAGDNSKHVEGFSEVQKTFNFQVEKFKEVGERLAVTIGEKLLPVVQKVFNFIENHKTLFKYLAEGAGALALSLGLAGGAVMAFAVLSNPVGLMVAALAGVVTGMTILYQKSQLFRKVVAVQFMQVAGSALIMAQDAVKAFKMIADTAMYSAEQALRALSHLPGLGGKFKQWADDIAATHKSTDDHLDGMLGTLNKWQASVDKTAFGIVLKGNITDFTKKIADAKKQLSDKNLPPAKQIKLSADISNWQAQVTAAKVALANTPEKKKAVLTAQIDSWMTQIDKAKTQLKNAPASKKAVLTAEIADLLRHVAQARAALAGVNSKTVHLTTVVSTVRSGPYAGKELPGARANGSLSGAGGVRRMADGDEGRQAAIAPGNSWILWAETAKPEAYIPLDPAKRKRSRTITTEVVKELGGAVAWKANGGITTMAKGGIPHLSSGLRDFAGGTGHYANVSAGGRTQMVKDSKSLITDVGAALITGVKGTTAQMLSAVKTLQSAATKVLTTNMVRVVNADNDKLKALGKQRAALVKQLSDAQAKAHDKHATKSQRAAAAKRANDLRDRISGIDKQEKGLRAEISRAKTVEKTGSAISKLVAADNAKLAALAKQRDGVAGKLKSAQDKLAAVQQQWNDEKSRVSQSVMGGLTAVTAANETGRPINAADVLNSFKAQAAKAQQFASLLGQLKSKGLNAATLDQLSAAGVEGGYDSALALAGGTAGQIQQINSLQKQTKAAADKAGTAVADSMYGAGVKSAQGLVDGLKAQQAAIEKQMLAIATSMQKAIKKALGIKSPSRVMAQLGDYTAQGFAVGIDRSAKHAAIAAQGMAMSVHQAARATSAGARRVTAPGSVTPAGGGVTNVYHVSVNVEGTVVSEQKLIDAVERGMARKGMNRSVTYQPYRR